MASRAAAALVCLFFAPALFSSPQVEARESKFFSKVTRYMSRTTAEGPSSGYPEAPAYAPAYAPAPAPEPESGIEDGNGLYGRGSEEFSTTTSTGSANQVAEELMDESNKEMEEGSNGYSDVYYQNNVYTGEKEGMSDTRFLEKGKFSYHTGGSGKSKNHGQYSPSSTNINGDTNEYNTPEQQEVVDARYSENGYSYKDTYDTNEYSTSSTTTTSNSKKNGYQVEQQGMSDTRFMKNGEFFYDLENEKKETNFNDGYTTEEKESNSHEFYYPNTENSGEFYSRYQGQQQEYQEDPEEYVP